MKKTLSFLLAVLLLGAVLLSGCRSTEEYKEKYEAVDQKVREYLDLMVQRDFDGMYAMLYPDVVSKEDYDALTDRMTAYCPIREGYELNMQTWDVYSRTDDGRDIVIITYELRFDGELFYLNTRYVTEKDAEGFTNIQFVSKADYDAAAAQSGK